MPDLPSVGHDEAALTPEMLKVACNVGLAVISHHFI
jgi:hypothetical protein